MEGMEREMEKDWLLARNIYMLVEDKASCFVDANGYLCLLQ